MKHFYLYLIPCLLLAGCQPYFEMVPPSGGTSTVQEFNENWYVTKNGTGVKNGSDWSNSMPFSEFLAMISNTTTGLSDAGIHIQEGEYLVTDADAFITISKDILCIRGGYSKDLLYDDLSKCDPELYPTIFTGDVSGDGEAGVGDGAFVFLSEGSIRFDNITFRNFYQSQAIATELEGKGSAVFGINGSYLKTSVECNNCKFENNVNSVSGTSGQEGGPCAFITEGYFKARDCSFTGNSGNSRGGAIRTNGKKGVVFLDRCLFRGNTLTGGSFGSAIQNSAGVICMNNTTMVGNIGPGSTLNGGGSFFVGSSTIVDGSAPDGTNNAAFRCESKKEQGTVIINSVFTNTNTAGYGLLMNASGVLVSKGYNVIKSIYLGSGCVDPTVGADLTKDIQLEGELDEGVWQWDVAKLGEDFKAYAVSDNVYAAAQAFDPSAYCDISVLGRAFANWVNPLSFSLDGRGEDRGEDAIQPGAYDQYLDE